MIVKETESGLSIPPDATHQATKPPIGPTAYKPGVDPTRLYVTGEPRLFVSQYIRALPQYVDDITRDFGSDLYERMNNDAKVYKNVNLLKTSILADGYRAKCKIKDEKDPRYQRAKLYTDFCDSNLDALPRPFDSFLFEMLDGLYLGNKVAEQTWDVCRFGRWRNLLMLETIMTKPRDTTAFVIDAWNRIVGLLGLIPGHGAPILAGHIVASPSQLTNLLPREKFAVFTFNPRNGDPRGRSILRPAYFPWWVKQQVWGEYLRYLSQFAGASLWATTPEGAETAIPSDRYGNPTGAAVLTPQEKLLAQLQAIRNGSCGAFPHGTEINALPVTGAGEPFLQAFHYCDTQITEAITSQSLATEEGQHQARAAAETHADIREIGVKHARRMVSMMVRRDIFRPLIMWNFNDDDKEELIPDFDLGGVTAPDWDSRASAVATLTTSGFLDESQKQSLDEQLGLPPRKPNSISVTVPDGPYYQMRDQNIPITDLDGTAATSDLRTQMPQVSANPHPATGGAGLPSVQAPDLSQFDPVEVHKGMEIEMPQSDDNASAMVKVYNNLKTDQHFYSKGMHMQAAFSLPADIARAEKETDTNASDEQKEAGNYKKGKFTMHGLTISVENPKGSVRSGVSKSGKKWSQKMRNTYGYIKQTESEADGDHVDVFIGPTPQSEIVFVIDQKNEDGDFDEHKCMLGFISSQEAKEAYLSNYEPGWQGFGGIKAMSMDDFKAWLESGDTGSPVIAADSDEPEQLASGEGDAFDSFAKVTDAMMKAEKLVKLLGISERDALAAVKEIGEP